MHIVTMHTTVERSLLATLCEEAGNGEPIGQPERSGAEAAALVRAGSSRFVTVPQCDRVGDDGRCMGHAEEIAR